MKAGLSTIQQTLTPEAASVLNHSIAEAGRRNHGQTTPLHVAATLLASPSGFLRQACIRSHPNSSHPLQCRALELCFSVALERLPTAQNMAPGTEPPISNALMAALKRAQAHQRRGCPEQQQQPLLAVKVELEQLIISILDDPSVSRVMREASFSSPAVKATIEQSQNSQAASVNSAPIGIGFRATLAPTPIPSPIPAVPNRNLYLNPRLQQGNPGQPGHQRSEEVKKVIDIMLRSKKRNPVLVGESEPEVVVKEVLRRIEKGEVREGPLNNAQVIAIGKELVSDKSQIPTMIKELGGEIEARMGTAGGGGIVLDLGDLKWLVEQPVSFGSVGVPQQMVSETVRMALAEMASLLSRFGGVSGGGLWLIGAATCETYLRCQVYHTSMENDWDLQAVPITSRSPLSGMFPRVGNTGILSSSIESLNPLKSLPSATLALPRRLPENTAVTQRMKCCPQCTENYEQELAKLVAKEFEKSSSDIIKSEAVHPQLPRWLQNAKADTKITDQALTKDQEMIFKQRSIELQKKWSDMCLHLHPNFHHGLRLDKMAPTSLAMPGLYNPNLLARQPSQPKLRQTRHLGETLQLNANPITKPLLEKADSQLGSPVRTDLALGMAKVTETTPEKTPTDPVKDFLGCISSDPPVKVHELQAEKYAKAADTDTFKKLLKGLMETAWWQQEAASALATAVTRCRMGNGIRRGGVSKGDIWLLFTGPDRIAKRKMASVLAEQICDANPITICLGSRHDDEETDMAFRGRTALDRIAEAVRRNPFSVIMLEDIDEADMVVRGSIRRAMERGRLTDSHGREMSLGNVIFILTAKPDDLRNVANLAEKRFSSVASGNWQLRLSIAEKSAKRRASWPHDEDRITKPRKQTGFSGLSFDLNLAADAEDDRTDGSHNSSDLTYEHEAELGLETRQFSITSVPHELVVHVDDTIVFKPLNFGAIRREIENRITEKFSDVVENKLSIELEGAALEKVLGGVWLGRTSLDEWAEKVLSPSFERLMVRLPSPGRLDEALVVRLELDGDSGHRNSGDWLPSQVRLVVDGV